MVEAARALYFRVARCHTYTPRHVASSLLQRAHDAIPRAHTQTEQAHGHKRQVFVNQGAEYFSIVPKSDQKNRLGRGERVRSFRRPLFSRYLSLALRYYYDIKRKNMEPYRKKVSNRPWLVVCHGVETPGEKTDKKGRTGPIPPT